MKKLLLTALIAAVATVAPRIASAGGLVGGGNAKGNVMVVTGGTAAPVRVQNDYGRFQGIEEAAELTDKQAEKVREIVKDTPKKTKAWHNSADGKRYQKLAEKYWRLRQAARAKGEKETEELKKVAAEKEKAKASYLKITEGEESAVMEVLKPKQRLAWERHSLQNRMSRLFKRFELTEAQEKQIEKLCEQWAMQYVDIDSDFTQKRREIDSKLIKHIEQEVLTKDQVAKLDELEGEDAETEGAEKPERVELRNGGSSVTITVKGGMGGNIQVKNVKVVGGQQKPEDQKNRDEDDAEDADAEKAEDRD